MPLHDFRCPAGHTFEAQVGHGINHQFCSCGETASKIFLVAPAGFVQKDIHYRSPVDDRPITSRAAREDDLARHGCVAYEPGMKQDAERNRLEADAKLERALDHTAEAFVECLDARKKEALAKEVTSGADLQLVRGTPAIN